MIAVEEELIDKITATFHYLRSGKVPQPIPIPDDLPDNEIRQLLTYVNRFLVEFALFTESMAQIAQGELANLPGGGRHGRYSFLQGPAIEPQAPHLEDPTDRCG